MWVQLLILHRISSLSGSNVPCCLTLMVVKTPNPAIIPSYSLREEKAWNLLRMMYSKLLYYDEKVRNILNLYLQTVAVTLETVTFQN